MSILDKLGLGRKKPDSSPNIGKKKKKKEEEEKARKNWYLRSIIFLVFLGSILATLPGTSYLPVGGYNVGEPWRADDLIAPFTFSLQKTSAELAEERDEIRDNTPPVFHVNNHASLMIDARIDSLYRGIQPVFDNYIQWQRAMEEENNSAPTDSVRYMQERNYSGIDLYDRAWTTLLENHLAVSEGDEPETNLYTEQIRNQLEEVIQELLAEGIIDRNKDGLRHNEITVRNLRERTERTINLANTRDIPEARDFAYFILSRSLASDVSQVAMQILDTVLIANWEYSESDTEAVLEENLENISTTRGAVEEGEVIIRQGDIVTLERDVMIRSLSEARAVTASQFEQYTRYLGEALVIVFASMLFLIYIFLYRKKIFNKPSFFLLVFLAMGIIAVVSALIYPFDSVNSYIVPIAVAPIILTIIFDSRVGLMSALTLAIITGVIHDNSFEYLVATITACSLGVFSVRDIKRRSQFFFVTPGIIFGTYLLVLSGFALARFSGWDQLGTDILFVSINAVFILFTYPLIMVFEKSFKITTDFTLLELADTNLPLMKDLMNNAPGTFHHSLQVANLAESAASEIGANALLCRVGAMYHDIGKMEKPAYFIENQNAGNDHDKLKPRMSALVIKAHVTDGVKMAEEHDLPQVIIDFIKTHHGTSLIKYFYKRAMDQAEDEEINEKDFRYDGPIPFSKEQGILLLADGIEAASRSMKDPTYAKLETLINKMVEDHIHDGQLSNCPLTFRQIQIIKTTFLNILVGVYHSRIEYPEDKKDGQAQLSDKKEKKEVKKAIEKGKSM